MLKNSGNTILFYVFTWITYLILNMFFEEDLLSLKGLARSVIFITLFILLNKFVIKISFDKKDS